MATALAENHLLLTAEIRSAMSAIQDLLQALMQPRREVAEIPTVYLHGPSGVGKSHLMKSLVSELQDAQQTACVLSANDVANLDDRADARSADLCIVEDLQHLPARFADALIRLIDTRWSHGLPMVFTASAGPAQLAPRCMQIGRRLASRLASGLVVRVDPMGPSTRRQMLQAMTQEASLRLAPEVIDWLTRHLTGSGRQVEGAVRRLQALQRLQKTPMGLVDVREAFQTETSMVQRIANRVGDHFQVAPNRLLSTRRSRDVRFARQVSMYLARQLSPWSLRRIGAYFGGRDHKTVHHACELVTRSMQSDSVLDAAIRQLNAELA